MKLQVIYCLRISDAYSLFNRNSFFIWTETGISVQVQISAETVTEPNFGQSQVLIYNDSLKYES